MRKSFALSALFAAPLLIGAQVAMADTVTVDSCGRDVTFNTSPSKVIVHDLNMNEMAMALNLQDKMVGVTGVTGWYKTEGPALLEKLGGVPELAPKYPSLENLLAAEPDLFIAGWYYGMKPGGEVTPDILEQHGIKTLELTESCVHLDKNKKAASMDLLFDDMLRLGKVFDKEQEADTLVDGWKKELSSIKEAVGENAGTRVFLYDSGDEKPFTAGKYAIPTAMIEAAGGKNILDDMDTSWGRANWETVASRNPEFLVLLDYSQDGSGAAGLMDFLKSHPVMSETDAVKNGRFVALRYAELTPGPANIEAIRKIAAAMNPESF
ncbi:ABC transporter substrate-binding protein [Curvivirga aplysinae]|uniref:ABC transporter substrate-binding protein n=1 Tax=Curvivirga aplysinae TaxID=2529852 RepID=UPI001C3FCFB4|nr:ABC transporter substrate-binding protein [Curvivirga aplysinae]